MGVAALATAAWAEVAMVGATSEAGAASAVLPTVRLVGCLAVAAREAAVMAPEVTGRPQRGPQRGR